MKKANKISALLLAGILSLGLLASCSSGSGSATATPTAAPTEKPVTIASAADLQGKKIAVQEGTTGDILATGIEGAQITRFKKATDCALELINGRVDCVIIDEMPAKKLVEANSDKLQLLDFPASEEIEAYAIAIAKDNTELLDKFNAALATIKENGTYDLLFSEYISGEDVELPAIPDYESSGKLIMGTNAAFEPFEYRDDSNEVVGFDVDLAKYICAELGVTLEISDMDFDALIPALETGKIDFIAAGMTATDERRQNVDFTDDYYESTQAIIVQK
ncbi:transporter substrate-binding domain-containing protein [Papillibacter cinnamivorans]|uniref:Amino acid ABC transporter substrate-binding protein, PAAT family n=1 Tax=Papillibacter cinnamivorans DSM 12816 TaxID=1122930 RepID=A0A1W2CRW3_9FIRM|nr:transporter substrate-binding domain-containing protein [Papillibacter cinnamivorans]SMC87632.1 amino acid ABC transporter substrate-binding protein, PAAT family [Papillibacter cinnamivorans DSM 12816]